MAQTIQPANGKEDADNDAAVALIRSKLHSLYSQEPDAKIESKEVETVTKPLSKHQQFMHKLNHSGKSLAEIQTEWHVYYNRLSDDEKHEVWQEFYAVHNSQSRHHTTSNHQTAAEAEKKHIVPEPPKPLIDDRSQYVIQKQVVKKVEKRAKLKTKHHVQSLVFGLSMGSVVVFLLLFTFFNERFITPFISPSRSVSATPIIVDPTNNTVSTEPKIIIPKINVEIPVLYNVKSIDENAIQEGLEESVVHYPTTSKPGEAGNGVIFGHSSSNIFNSGKAKFAFLQLKELQEGDTFYLHKDGKQYVYKVIHKQVVKPTQVEVINDSHGKPATFTLITCDPPGANVNRLVVTGEQISPAPASNQPSTAQPATTQSPKELPGNSESMWHRLTNWLSQ
jgi:sortase A